MAAWRAGAYFHGVRLHAATCLVLAAALVLRLQTGASSPDEAAVLLELVTPLPALVAAAGLLQADPALELLASYCTPLGRLLLQRWLVVVLLSLLAPLALHVAALHLWSGTYLSPLTWLAPLLFLSALAMAASALFVSSLAGLGVALAYWAASIVTTPALREACLARSGEFCPAAVWSTSYGLLAGAGPGWLINRLLLLTLACALALIAARLYRHPERQLMARTREEEDR